MQASGKHRRAGSRGAEPVHPVGRQDLCGPRCAEGGNRPLAGGRACFALPLQPAAVASVVGRATMQRQSLAKSAVVEAAAVFRSWRRVVGQRDPTKAPWLLRGGEKQQWRAWGQCEKAWVTGGSGESGVTHGGRTRTTGPQRCTVTDHDKGQLEQRPAVGTRSLTRLAPPGASVHRRLVPVVANGRTPQTLSAEEVLETRAPMVGQGGIGEQQRQEARAVLMSRRRCRRWFSPSTTERRC